MNEAQAQNQDQDKIRAFVLNNAGHNFNDARRFADELIDLTTGTVNTFNLDRLQADIEASLVANDYNPETDYLIISGSPVIGLVVGSLLGRFAGKNRRALLLLWDARLRLYISRTYEIK